ncbi:NAD(P)/FAD-dependent oxidoreductase [Falsihalocynthiibacter sp. SS001]|uniref:NAD(P)/FAD-dependent oxidoreductase n=1 Tax=Falsihalocynthiibacter sp. SS001 TaxID=3349698 RepID=UPI0036D43399
MAMPEITVMGAGAFGLSVAYVCAKAGAKVQVVEKTAVGAGASGGLVGALAPHTPERWDDKKQFQLESLLMAEGFWRGVEADSGLVTGYERVGRLQPINTPRILELSHERTNYAEQHWRGEASWNVVRYEDHVGWAPQSKTGFLVHDTLSARLHPRLATLALAQAVTRLGGEIIIGRYTPVSSNTKVIWATGVDGLHQLSEEFGTQVGSGEKGQAALLGYSSANQTQLFADSIYVVPHANGTTAIGSTTERYFEKADETDQHLDDLIARAFETFPILANAPVIERWASARPRSFTRAPMIGKYPNRDGHFIANGGFKIGFGMAPKLAQTLAALVLEGNDAIPDHFSVEANLGSATA